MSSVTPIFCYRIMIIKHDIRTTFLQSLKNPVGRLGDTFNFQIKMGVTKLIYEL